MVESRELWTHVFVDDREPAPYTDSQIGGDNVEEIVIPVEGSESGQVIGPQPKVILTLHGKSQQIPKPLC